MRRRRPKAGASISHGDGGRRIREVDRRRLEFESEVGAGSGGAHGECARRGGPGPVRAFGRRGRRGRGCAGTRWRQNRARRRVGWLHSARRRRCSAGSSGAKRVTSMASAREGVGSAARPPPRTGRPGMRICGATRASSDLPPGFFVARQFGHLGQVLAQSRVPGLEQRQQFVADAVAGVGEVAVG